MTERPALPVASDGSDALQVAVRVAEAAGAEITRRLPDTLGSGAKERLGLRTKGGWNDRVTEVDKAAEDAALAVLTNAFPEHDIFAEESGAHGRAPRSDGTSTPSTARGTSRAGSRTSA